MNKKTIKRIIGSRNIKITKNNMMIEPVHSIQDLISWEKRLKVLDQKYCIATFEALSPETRKFEKVYSIFTDMSSEHSAFSEINKEVIDESEI
jgi:hypothetical protein